jgi:hypothetical protein
MVTRRRTKILDVPVFGQRTAACGPTSLKAVCWYHGVRLSARRLAALCRLGGDGVDHEPLARAAVATGARVLTHASGTLAELGWFAAAGYPAIVGWWSLAPGDSHLDPSWTAAERRARDCGHYSVVCGVSREHIWLMDPQRELRGGRWRTVGRRRMATRDFLRVWYDTDTSRHVRVDRWYMVLHYGDEELSPPGRGEPSRATRRRRPCGT